MIKNIWDVMGKRADDRGALYNWAATDRYLEKSRLLGDRPSAVPQWRPLFCDMISHDIFISLFMDAGE